MTSHEPTPFAPAPTTDTLIKQSRRLLQALRNAQHELERFVVDLERQTEQGDKGG